MTQRPQPPPPPPAPPTRADRLRQVLSHAISEARNSISEDDIRRCYGIRALGKNSDGIVSAVLAAVDSVGPKITEALLELPEIDGKLQEVEDSFLRETAAATVRKTRAAIDDEGGIDDIVRAASHISDPSEAVRYVRFALGDRERDRLRTELERAEAECAALREEVQEAASEAGGAAERLQKVEESFAVAADAGSVVSAVAMGIG
mmetsp:Transcript_32068/g.63525  ORF Transcript_32068/g.63525 Transcript_32068/m.63525 type:complete len:205 (-) Transcript_32068:30-644(-)|eukprot:CAMPEP_0194310908 /NCGR_PEP_ID=MMETSP0171-20130528/7892_1 /TAXON_ID=218684 /ORGANISM="Corethron pennatum, Strain L29A3" /LENGTH=204 /DNA_ID=CAMNT_0039064771 /DNA_START=139 /DNA_END=753 /DNA_ORIENTATION=-